MNNKVNYTAVGLLVLFGFFLIVAFSYWLLKPTAEEETTTYKIYFNESVLGLNIDAPVKYRGISVGKVSKLRINPHNSEQVEAQIKVLSTTPIKVDTEAKLTSQGITGLSYINLSMGGNNSAPLKPKGDESYAVIKSVPSFFEDFEKSLDIVSSKLSKTLSKTDQLLNDENQKEFALLLKRTSTLIDKLNRTFDDKTILSLQKSIKNLESASKKVDETMPHIEKLIMKSSDWEDKISTSFASITNTYSSMGVTMDGMKEALNNGERDFSNIVPSINDTLLQMQELMLKLQSGINSYERSPGDILYRQEEIRKGPGEN